MWEQKPLLLSSVTSKTIWFPREEQTREQLLVFSTVHRHLRHAHVNYKIQYLCVCVLVAQSCPALCNPMDCSPPASSVHGILHARILEWVAIPFSRGSSQPKDQTRLHLLHWQADSLPLSHLEVSITIRNSHYSYYYLPHLRGKQI